MTYYKAIRCECGCGHEVIPKTPGRAARFIHGHNRPSRPVVPLARRFWPRVQVGSPDECWPWTGGSDSDGRGRVWLDGKNIPAPRAALILSGVLVEPGSFICHHCDNPPCVNPNHLYVGSPMSNVRDMLARGRGRSKGVPRPASHGEKNHNAKLSDADVREIRQRYTGVRGEQTLLAQEFGVTQALIHMIVKGDHRG